MLEEWQVRRFSRQILLRDVGGIGQRRLLDASVRIGRLDAPGRECAMWLARSGIGTLCLPDDVSLAPLTDSAGLLHATDAGRPLGEAVRQRLVEQQPSIRFAAIVDSTFEASGGVEGALDIVRELVRAQRSEA